MDEPTGRGRATLVEGDVELDARDAVLLRTIARTGSVAGASAELGRSRARALSRIETLESAFGELVERRRGGSGGGGSRLTEAGARLLNRYDRLAAAIAATARVPETVLEGTVADVDGELAAVETAVGTVWGLHEGVSAGRTVQARIGGDAVTVRTTNGDGPATSARNRRHGRIEGVDRGETVHVVRVRVDDATVRALVTDGSAERLGIREGNPVRIAWKATATRLVGETNG
jgi:molybdate transport system regulatory protein